jgi:iron complex outermembrane receptor protein
VLLCALPALSLRALAEQPATPQQNLKGLSLEELGHIEVVTYSKAPTGLWATPAAMAVITSEDIRRSGATSIADALRLVPGVEVARLSSTTWAIGIRGLENNFSKSVLVLVDGRNVYTPLFAGVYWDVQDMPLEDIDRIEVIRGAGGTIWGPNAANGVINIITKSAADTQGVHAAALVGTSDHTIDNLQYGLQSGDLTARVYGRGFTREHEHHTDGINDDDWHQERVGFRADLASGRDRYFAEGDAYRGNSPHLLGTTPVHDETSGGDINLMWERQFHSGSGFYLQAYFDRTLRDRTPLGETRNTIDIDFIQRFHAFGRHSITYGGGLHWSPYKILAEIPFETLVPSSGTDHVHTGFLQDDIALTHDLSLTVGAKLQHNNYSGFALQPSGRLLWNMREHQALWLGITHAITNPSDIEENFFLEGPAGPNLFIQVVGNKQFKAEDVITYEAGYRALFGDRLYLDLSGFWNQYSRLQSFSAPVVSTSGANSFITIEYENQISGSTTGFEIAPQIGLARWWHFNPSYSFVSSNFSASGPTSDISATGSVSTYERSTPKHIVFLQSKMDLPWRLEFDQMYRFVTALPAQRVGAYQTMDLHLAKPLGRGFTLTAVGQGLFQPHHLEWGTGDPTQAPVGINRAAYVQLAWQSPPRASH